MSSSGSGAISLAHPSLPQAKAPRHAPAARARARRLGVRALALGYLALLLLAPLVMIFYRTFEHGLGGVRPALSASNFQHAFWRSLEVVAIAVPLNTIFGIGLARLSERVGIRGKALIGTRIELPFA